MSDAVRTEKLPLSKRATRAKAADCIRPTPLNCATSNPLNPLRLRGSRNFSSLRTLGPAVVAAIKPPVKKSDHLSSGKFAAMPEGGPLMSFVLDVAAGVLIAAAIVGRAKNAFALSIPFTICTSVSVTNSPSSMRHLRVYPVATALITACAGSVSLSLAPSCSSLKFLLSYSANVGRMKSAISAIAGAEPFHEGRGANGGVSPSDRAVHAGRRRIASALLLAAGAPVALGSRFRGNDEHCIRLR